MSKKTLLYALGSWEDSILLAIIRDSIYDKEGIIKKTKLSEKEFYIAIKNLQQDGHVDILSNGTYWVKQPSYRQFVSTSPKLIGVKQKKDPIVNWIRQWRKLKQIKFSLRPKHFFLQGRYLDDFSTDLICHANHEVVVVNPFVHRCNLSNSLVDATSHDANVMVITRPIVETSRYRDDGLAYHDQLKSKGIQFHYHPNVHAKIIIVDQKIAIISSMNFNVTSSGGTSWEAGLVTMNASIVKNILQDVSDLLV
jgi:phosphatidylserine/phosphatidylglycerophosphate/cardiolipin synthase-like enzyme